MGKMAGVETNIYKNRNDTTEDPAINDYYSMPTIIIKFDGNWLHMVTSEIEPDYLYKHLITLFLALYKNNELKNNE